MHTDVSVKKPTRGGWSGSYPSTFWTSGRGPYSRFSESLPVKAGLAELTVVMPGPLPSSSRARPAPGLLGRRGRVVLDVASWCNIFEYCISVLICGDAHHS